MIQYLLAALLAAIDLKAKDAIEKSSDLPKEFHGIKITRVHNHGFAFGIGTKHPELPKIMSLLMLLISLPYLAAQKNTSKKFLLGSALFLGGAASNTADRLTRGYVVDYITFKGTIFKKYVYNLGDFFLLLGGLMITASALPKEDSL